MKPYWQRQQAIEKLEVEIEELHDKIEQRKMKAILEFNLPEDREAFEIASKAMDWALVAWEMDQLLRNKLKHGAPTHHVHLLEELRDTLNNMLIDKGLDYPE